LAAEASSRSPAAERSFLTAAYIQGPMPRLAGTRVVSIALNAPGPLAAAQLRQHGASVLKVEPPAGDPLRTNSPSWYAELHEGIPVEMLDLKTEAGRRRMHEALGDADLFLASQRPSALVRLGLDADTLLATGQPFSRLRHLNIVGEIDHPEIAGHDLTYLGRAGLLGIEVPLTLMADVIGSERAFAAALLLLAQPPGARGQLGLYDSLAPLVAPFRHGLTQRGGLLGGGLPAYGIYAAREGRVAVAALETHFRAHLYEALDLPRGSDLTAAFKARTAAEWEAWAIERDLPIVAVAENTTRDDSGS
jgi:crotonobetainyl-CoA:carnitine CoA-transferase CaiB-like acyl-CoA transferase